MKTAAELKKKLQEIDHKSYSLYKTIAGEYRFDQFILCIDKVQGDPFASPSRVRVIVPEKVHGFPLFLYEDPCKRIALEDSILRKWNRFIGKQNQKAGSGNSGKLGVCICGQEILERQAVCIKEKKIEGYFLIGFPARGRSILAEELIKIL
ncbi:MAG: isopentenyl-diphosphate delta-isomerase, partial [Lachnospiraceae bacterium]|nr:isopentenyl-diphosphate delta-isomerase [Lachnospiraceae bacterium]